MIGTTGILIIASFSEPFKRQLHRMVEHTQIIRWQFADELFDCDHFVGLSLKGLDV